jgi:hypothetical protein
MFVVKNSQLVRPPGVRDVQRLAVLPFKSLFRYQILATTVDSNTTN